jgi:ABC-type nitrate/sulfonate/bicarbonate transport system permease component
MYHGARGIPPRYIDVARSFGMARLPAFRKVLMPALYPYVITALRLGFVHSLRGMVVAEMFILVGFGDLIHNTGLDLSTAPLLSLLLALMIVSMGANALFEWAGGRLAPWYSQKTAVHP